MDDEPETEEAKQAVAEARAWLQRKGGKRSNGAYWGYKRDAKKESNRARRTNWRREIASQTETILNSAQIFHSWKRLSTRTGDFRGGFRYCRRHY